MNSTWQSGDIVSVESGKYIGCRLTWVGQAGGWHVCLNSYEVGGFVRVRRVAFVRPIGDWRAAADPVLVRDFDQRLAFAKRMTGAAEGDA